MPTENHEEEHREFRKWMIETQANIRFVKFAASIGVVGFIARWVG